MMAPVSASSWPLVGVAEVLPALSLARVQSAN